MFERFTTTDWPAFKSWVAQPLVKRRLLKYGLGGAGGIILASVLAFAGYVFWITSDLPSYASLANYEPPVTTRVYAGDGTLIGEYARERRLFVPIGSIPNLVREAFLSAEDKNFYNHPGVDFFAIMRAAAENVPNVLLRRELHGGASTITQQVARDFLLSNEVTISRKVKEMFLAMKIDSAYDKNKILELYLNEIFLGQNSYGVAAAATNYFNKSLDELKPSEVAFLAALPKGPSNYDPVRRKAAAIARRNWVLDQMADNGYLSKADVAAAKSDDLVTQTRNFGAVAPDVDYFVEEVRRVLYEKYGSQALYDGGLQVRSTLQPKLQEIAVRSLRQGLINYDRRHGWRGPVTKLEMNGEWQAKLAKMPNASGVAAWRVAAVTGFEGTDAVIAFGDDTASRIPLTELSWARAQLKTWVGPEVKKPSDALHIGDVVYVEPVAKDGKPTGQYGLRQVPEINGAAVAIDPFTGHVLALSGGFSYASSEFDRAMQAMRQVGSTFKPFVYATALDHGYTPVSKVLDEPFTIEQGPGLPLWSPQNYEAGEFLGPTTLRRGVEQSRNVMTARLANELGMEPIADTAVRMGVYDKLPLLLANSLGASETTLLRLATAYGEFVNGGRKLTPTLIDHIQDRHGKITYRIDARSCDGCGDADFHGQDEPLLDESHTQVLDPLTAYQIVSILQGVVQRGTGSVINTVGKPLAGKTGTSSDFHDTWFVGFSPDLVFGVYVGFDNPRSLGKGEAAAEVTAPIFRDFMKEVLADKPGTPFRVPAGIELVSVDAVSGAPVTAGTPGSIVEAFKPGTEPGADNNDVLGVSAGPADVAPRPADTVKTEIGKGTGGLY